MRAVHGDRNGGSPVRAADEPSGSQSRCGKFVFLRNRNRHQAGLAYRRAQAAGEGSGGAHLHNGRQDDRGRAHPRKCPRDRPLRDAGRWIAASRAHHRSTVIAPLPDHVAIGIEAQVVFGADRFRPARIRMMNQSREAVAIHLAMVGRIDHDRVPVEMQTRVMHSRAHAGFRQILPHRLRVMRK